MGTYIAVLPKTDSEVVFTPLLETCEIEVAVGGAQIWISIEDANDWIKGLTEAREKFGTDILAALDKEEQELAT